MPYKDPEKRKAFAKEYGKQWYLENREETRAKKAIYREKNRDELRAAGKIYHQRYRERYIEKRAALKYAVFKYYSGGNVKCFECDIIDIDMLTLDHINNDGVEHRKKIGNKIYKWVIENNFPKGFQVLCWNHNIKKEVVRKRNKDLLSQ